jgi:glycosyltransferase involved in cell wall biosynthesis
MNLPGCSLLNRATGWLKGLMGDYDLPAVSPFKAQAGAFAEVEPAPPDSPLVSVVIPCFNHGRVVGEAVESILKQTWQDTEILIVDDGSDQPETIAILEDFSRPRTRVFHHQQNLGLPAARNTGIQNAKGKYICCLDADDKLHPTYLEKALCLMESNLGIDFVYAWTQVFGEENRVWYALQFDPEGLLDHNQLNPPAVFRRRCWEKAGGFREVMRDGYEDWEFWIRLAYHGCRGFRIPEKLIYVRREGESFIHRAAARHQELVQQIKDLNPEVYQDRSWLRDVLREYDDIYVDQPFYNLKDPDALRPLDNPRLLVYRGSQDSSSADFQRLLRALKAHRGEVVVVSLVPLREEAADKLLRLTEYVYILPHFLPDYAWDVFLEMVQTVRTGEGPPLS